MKGIWRSLCVLGFVTALALTGFASDSPVDRLLAAETEEAALQIVDSLIESGEGLSGEILEQLIRKGHHDVAERLIREFFVVKGIDVSQNIKKTVQDIKKNLDSLNSLSNLFSSKLHSVTPALQWAQDPDKIFLNVKYAHRFDSPGCLEVRDNVVDYGPTSIKFTGVGEQAGTPIHFDLPLELYAEINPKGCTHYSSSVGRMTIQCSKAKEETAWPRLLKNNKSHNGTIQTWWEMKSKYEDRMKKLEGKHEDGENEEKELDRKMEESKKKRKQRKKKLKGQLKVETEAKHTCWDGSKHLKRVCKEVTPEDPAYWWSSSL